MNVVPVDIRYALREAVNDVVHYATREVVYIAATDVTLGVVNNSVHRAIRDEVSQ